MARIFHAHLWGDREGKYGWLREHDVATTEWAELTPNKPFYLFVPQEENVRREYEIFWETAKIFSVYSLGVLTKRDSLVIGYEKNELLKRIDLFFDPAFSDGEIASKFNLPLEDKDKWNLKKVRQSTHKKAKSDLIKKILYRPFDVRHIYYDEALVARPNLRVLQHFLAANYGLLLGRQGEATGSEIWDVLFVTDSLVDQNIYRRGGGTVFPLYLYPSETPKASLFEEDEEASDAPGGRRPNLAPEFIEAFAQRLGMAFVPDGKGDLGRSAAVPAARPRDAGATSSATRDAGATVMDGDSPLRVRAGGRLPHWEKEGGIYFVTFRLADSLPHSLLTTWTEEREQLRQTMARQEGDLSPEDQARLAELVSDKVESYLDTGAGSCALSKPEVASIVADALRHFEGERYRLYAWCIMPNHVHVVFKPLAGFGLSDTLHSWKSYTSKRALEVLGAQGTFWQKEYYDHLVRDEEDFYRILQYVLDNPVRAGLKDWPWIAVNVESEPSEEGDAPASRGHAAGTAAPQGTFGPEDVFDYMYAVFHSPAYRARYAEFLKIDFPRLPLTSNPDLFRALCGLGARLVALHLMEARPPSLPDYPEEGDDVVEAVRYTEPGQGAEAGRVWINKTQYFEGVPPEVWEFHVGGYQVCAKWLKDRKGRALSYDDLEHYRRVVGALAETLRLMGEVDAAIEAGGGWPVT